MTTETYIDLSKANHELERMNQGQIPFDADYLKELVECDYDIELSLDVELTCSICGSFPVWVNCPECRVTHSQADCFMCDGAGGFYDCPKCSDGGVPLERNNQ